MTCKFCGSYLDGGETECPFCGHKTAEPEKKITLEPAEPAKENTAPRREASAPVTGARSKEAKQTKGKKSSFSLGDSLKNVSGKFSSTERKAPAAATKSQTKAGGTKLALNSTVLTIGAVIVCALLCLITLISVGNVRKELNTTNQDMLSLFYQLQNTNDQLSTKVSDLEKKINNLTAVTVTEVDTTTNTNTSTTIKITKDPTETATYLGRGGSSDTSQDVKIFTVYATGFDLSFTWQRFDDTTATWSDIAVDGDGINQNYGLKIYTDATMGYSEVLAHGVTSAAYGTYRCKITDASSSVTTTAVPLTERSKDA